MSAEISPAAREILRGMFGELQGQLEKDRCSRSLTPLPESAGSILRPRESCNVNEHRDFHFVKASESPAPMGKLEIKGLIVLAELWFLWTPTTSCSRQ
jgi:hypothetical protein